MYKLICFAFSWLLMISSQLSSAELGESKNVRNATIIELNLDRDLQEKLEELSSKFVAELKYNEVADILNEQQKRHSMALGFIVPVSHHKIVPIHTYDDKLLEELYSFDKLKLKEAKSYWNWHKRTGVIGLPPQWPVTLKKCISYGGGIVIAGAAYCIYHSGFSTSNETH